MKSVLTFLSLVAILFTSTFALADTEVSGHITSDTTWTLAESPYLVTGDVTVRLNSSAPATLTIEPGVVVKFSAGTGLYVGYSSTWGALDARGTAAEPIVFTSAEAAPAPGDWKGIIFRNYTDDARSVLKHCLIEYGGHTHDANVYCTYASPTIQNCTIGRGSGHGILLAGDASPTIGGEGTGNIIQDNGGYGILSDGTSTFPVITHNMLSDNVAGAMRVRPQMAEIGFNSGSGNGRDVIELLGEYVAADTIWRRNDLPYQVTGDVTVRLNNSAPATLTIEPGVVVEFSAGTGLYVGYSSAWGALLAQGTAAEPIVFTSAAETPAPGDWKGIYLTNYSDDTLTLIEHCLVEYGGLSHNANLYCSNAAPRIQYSTLRNSSHSGIYATGTGSNSLLVNCNNLKDNLYGVYLTGNAQPTIENNNFLRNQSHGIYNASSVSVSAPGNWWGDANGPNFNGDATFGDVTADPWLTAPSTCIDTPPTNSPPFEPRQPVPATGAVRIPVTVSLSWLGGDPNPWDTVQYNLYHGTSADSLSLTAQDLAATSLDLEGLNAGTTYYWQVVATDDTGAQTSGPVWHFTTLGDPPDLVVDHIAWDPATGLTAGEEITLTATVGNSGSGPVVDAFDVEFRIDGASIGSRQIDAVIHVGETAQATLTWTARTGAHDLEVVVDSTEAVTESYENNNTATVTLPTVDDTTAPELVSTAPVDDANVVQADTIAVVLNDVHGSVDDAAVIASFSVTDAGSQAVPGSVTENADTFTFTPAAVLADGFYQVSLTAADTAGNTQVYAFGFTVDSQAPAAPMLTGEALLTGVAQVRPFQNQANTTTVTLTGSREADTALWVGGTQMAALGSDDWSVDLTLNAGDNALELWLTDTAGNRSVSIWVDIQVDATAPAVTAVSPVDDTFTQTPPATVVVTYAESGSGLDAADSALRLENAGHGEIAGSWALSGADQLVFTPSAELADGEYTLLLELEDAFTNRAALTTSHFTVDRVAPAAPVIDALSSPTHNPNQTVNGTKEAYAAIYAGGEMVVDHTVGTTWQYAVTLVSGSNTISVTARDRAGNQSDPATVEIVFDDIAPDAVTTLIVNAEGSGTTAELSWAGYDEGAHGDIAAYRIYRELSGFSDVSGLTARATAAAGTFTHGFTGLTQGTPYWFAVVAVDAAGNFNPAVTAVSATPTDTLAPENASGLTTQSFADRLIFSWTASVDSQGDLAGYKVYFDGASEAVTLAADQHSYERTGLSAAQAYAFKITAVDTSDNESMGITTTGYTWLANPAGIFAEPFSGYVKLDWSPSTPSEHVKHYAVYASDTGFSDVAGMSPSITTTNTTAKVAGLTNGTVYYLAVTAVNLSNGERTNVVTTAATPQADIDGPELTDLMAGETALVNGMTIESATVLSLSATDASGVSRVEFLLDGELIRTDFNAPYSCYLDPAAYADGSHTLTIVAYDTLDNQQRLDFTINTALAVPVAPTILIPTTGTTTNKTEITVQGRAEKESQVLLYLGGSPTGDTTTADRLGNFSLTVTLAEGLNTLQAAAENRSGTGELSAAVEVTLNTSIPLAPTGVTATAREGGRIRIAWQPPADSAITGYRIYRSDAAFDQIAAATLVNTDLVAGNGYTDLPGAEGTWYYRVTSMNAVGNESELSPAAAADADNTPPRATAIIYSPQGNFDATSGIMAPGQVGVDLTVSEPLAAVPFLSITPVGGLPISVELAKVGDTAYAGAFTLTAATPSGTAYAVFSGRDTVGNRGTEIDTGGTLGFDTEGPAVRSLSLSPASPVKNDEQAPVTLTATLGLTEAVKAGTRPELAYLLSQEGRQAVAITQIQPMATQAGDTETWQAVFELPADAGLAAAETLQFFFLARDDLDNESDKIQAANQFQVYQGDLPPLAAPTGLTARALPGGQIQLAWNAVDEAIAYRLYRMAPGESELTAYQRIESTLTYTDTTTVDGEYAYAVASIRSENGEEAESGLSPAVTASADAQAPGAPLNLALELVGAGIQALWDPPAYTEPVTYALYRADTSEITSVEGLMPLATGIEAIPAIDPHPSHTDHCYVVTAVDAAGNESPPSNSFYLNFDLLPVSTLSVIQTGTEAPQLSWTHADGDVAGYDIYAGPRDGQVKINATLATDTSYTDTGFADNERHYTIVAVDGSAAESVGRKITLPKLGVTLPANAQLKRGLMNRLDYQVVNQGENAVSGVRLKATVGGVDHLSASFDLAAAETRTVSVVVGGYDTLADLEPLTTTARITPNEGELVEIARSREISVADGMLVAQLMPEDFTRGGDGAVRFSLLNSGAADIEIVTAKNTGNAASDQIAFYLLDEDENVLSTVPFKQALGEKVLTLTNGDTIARIPAGETFVSDALSIPVPSSAPDEITVRLEIAHVYHDHGKTEQVQMDGLGTNQAVTLVETAYYGELVDITPQSSRGDQDIVITGRAVDRTTGDPLGDVPLKLVISLDGFERSFDIETEENGSFAHLFTPLSGEGGIYSVRVVHPDITERPVHGSFTVNRIELTPRTLNLSIPKNYTFDGSVGIKASEGLVATNLRLVYEAGDQLTGGIDPSVHFTAGAPISPAETNQLSYTLWADNAAEETSDIRLRVVSDENLSPGWGKVTVKATFSEAKPALFFSPNYLETGVARSGAISETILLENRGVADMENVALALLMPSGAPAPAWAVMNTAADAGTLTVGEQKQVGLTFSPTDSVAEGIHQFLLRVSASNYPTTDINVYVAVTQSGIGNALFKIADIYTGTLDENEDLIQGLGGAKVHLQNELVLSENYEATSDELGEAFFEDLPAGHYQYRVTASNHEAYLGRLWIKAGITQSEDVFLDYNLISVEWEVVEVTVEDRYEIVLSATYETDVPAAVVVLEPASVTLPDMAPGDVYTGEVTLTNYGLIRADDLQFEMPSDDQFFSFEVLGGVPESLGAKERITIAYRVTSLRALDQSDDDGSGGGCASSYGVCGSVYYNYTCANGDTSTGNADHCIGAISNPCGGGIGGGGIWYGHSSGGSSGSGWSSSPSYSSMGGAQCIPEPNGINSSCENNGYAGCDGKSSCQSQSQTVKSSVDLISGKYHRHDIDLSVKVPGGMIDMRRSYIGSRWFFGAVGSKRYMPVTDHLEIENSCAVFIDGYQYLTGCSELEYLIAAGELSPDGSALGGSSSGGGGGGGGGVSSSPPPVDRSRDAGAYTSPVARVTKTVEGYRWYSLKGLWKSYSSDGHALAFGDAYGVIGQFIYADADAGKILGVADRNNTQVLWYEYDTEDRLVGVHDSEGRRAQYTYENDTLSTVIDVLNQETRFTYIGGSLNRVTDPLGRVWHINYGGNGRVTEFSGSGGYHYRFTYDYDKQTRERYTSVTSASGLIKEAWYTKRGNTFRVDINGRTVQSIRWAERDQLITDVNGLVTRHNYDVWGARTAVIHPDDAAEYTEYTAVASGPKATDPGFTGADDAFTDADISARRWAMTGGKSGGISTGPGSPAPKVVDGALLAESVGDPSKARARYRLVGDFDIQVDYNILKASSERENSWALVMRVLTPDEASYSHDGIGIARSWQHPLGPNFEYLGYADFYTFYHKNAPAEGGTPHIATAATAGQLRLTRSGNAISGFVRDNPSDGWIQVGSSFTHYGDADLVVELLTMGQPRESYVAATFDNFTVNQADGIEILPYLFEQNIQKISRSVDERGNVTTYEYNDDGRLTKKSEAVGTQDERVTEYEYDGQGNLTVIRRLADALTPESTATMTYDDNGNISSLTDPEDHTTEFTYDVMGNVLTRTDTRGKLWNYEYDAAGHLTKVIDPLGNMNQLFYDAKGNKTREIDPENKETTFEYDDLDHLVKIIDSVGNETLFSYDVDGNLTSRTDADGNSVFYEYDNEGRLLKTVDGNGNEIDVDYEKAPGEGCTTCSGGTHQPSKITFPSIAEELKYDVRGRKVLERFGFGGQDLDTTYSYDDAGNITAVSDREGRVTRFGYDALNRLVSVTDARSGETRYAYDNRDNLLQITDAQGHTTRFEYDRNNRLVREIRPMGQQTSYGYDPAGNLTEKIDAKGQKAGYGYDDAGRLEQIQYFAAGDHVSAVKTVTFSYDKAGNLTGYDDGATSAVYGYNDLNQRVSESVNYGPFSLTNEYTFYNNGLKQTFTGPDNITYGYLYDGNNQFSGLQIPDVGLITVNEYNWFQPEQESLPGGATRQYAYDGLMRTSGIDTQDPGQNPVVQQSLGYDRMDNVVSRSTLEGEQAYGYDELYRLTSVDHPNQSDEAFTYDGVGNRLTDVNSAGTWSYDDNNALMGYDDSVYQYDDNGNLIQKTAGGVVTRFFYNLEDRLERVEDGAGNLVASYGYDPFGRRLWKEVGGTRTYFSYSDEGLVGEYDATGNPIRSYGYKPNGLWGTNPQFLKVGASYYFYHNDQLGTPQKLTGETGAVVWSASYTSFGEASVAADSTVTNNLRFAGQYYDGESGLHYNWFRYYDPKTGRYLRPDPLGFIGGDANLYAYVWNDPVNWSDPSGLIPLDTLLDIVYIGIDVYNIATDICSRGEHIRSLGLDLLGMMLPYATGLGKAYRATKIHAPCFVEGTPVETESGLKPIEAVEVGDLILSRDEKTGERSFKEAVATYETPDQRIIEIQLKSEDGGTETIGATAGHPFWVKAKGWVGAGNLLPGDEVFSSQGGWIKVSGSTWLSKRQTVYNLEVEDYHTYFVGESGAWVHNICALPPQRTVKHHIFNKFRGISPKSKKYRDFFRKHNINVDDYAVLISEDRHVKQIHVRGNNWTTKWKRWIDNNPDATTSEVYQHAGRLMDDYGLNNLPIVKY